MPPKGEKQFLCLATVVQGTLDLASSGEFDVTSRGNDCCLSLVVMRDCDLAIASGIVAAFDQTIFQI